MVFWCGGGLFSAPEAVQREKVGKIGKRLFLILAPEAVQREKVRKIGKRLFFNRISERTLDTFLVRFRGVSVLHCHDILVWRVWRSIGKRLFLIGFQKGR